MTRPKRGQAFACVLLLNVTVLHSAWAQSDTEGVDSLDMSSANADADQTLGPISVTGVPLPGSPLSQAADVDVVESDAIEAKGATNLGEALDDLAGVDSIGTGNSVGKPVIRGLSGERIKILSNGVGVDHQQYGVRHMPTTDTFLLGRAEVVRGASSVLYGSSALGGAINLLPPEIAWDTPVEGETLTRYSTNNDQWDTGIKASGGNGRFGYAAGIVRRSAGDIETPDESTYFPPPPAERWTTVSLALDAGCEARAWTLRSLERFCLRLMVFPAALRTLERSCGICRGIVVAIDPVPNTVLHAVVDFEPRLKLTGAQ